MQRNIYIAYLLTITQHAWFWLGIWVLYYLKFTDYAGIGLIETAMIISATLFEIPSGALADIVGRKKIIFISLIFSAFGNILMGAAQNFIFLLIATIMPSRAFYSGTIESLLFDSLKQNGGEEKYHKVLANINSIMLATIAISGILGGFLYSINPRYPFYLCAIFNIFGMVIAFFIKEPNLTNKVKLSLNLYTDTLVNGTKQLFGNKNFRFLVVLFITIGSLIVISEEVLDYSLSVQFGFDEKALGILFAVVYLFATVFSQIGNTIVNKIGNYKSIILLSLIMIFSFLISPLISGVTGGIIILIRNSLFPVFNIISYTEINKNIESKYRTTVLSAFSMFKQVPYVISAFFVGYLTDVFTAVNVAFLLGIIFLILIVPQLILLIKRKSATIQR